MIWVIAILGAMLLIGLFPKQMLTLLGIILLIAILVFGYAQIEQRIRDRDQAAVNISVKFSVDGECDSEYPLLVTIRNSSKNVVEGVRWEFAAYRKGYSSNYVQFHLSNESDKILNPGESFSFCFRLPNLKQEEGVSPSSLDWHAESKWVKFKKE